MESMARGIPVLGYPAGGIFEMIEDGKTGFFVHDGSSFCRIVDILFSDEQKLKRMVQNAKEKIEREFSIYALHQNITQVYHSL